LIQIIPSIGIIEDAVLGTWDSLKILFRILIRLQSLIR